jgi:hypothetical protein
MRGEGLAFRFRRTLGLIPGVRLNLGKKGASLSFGIRGFHYTVGTQGKRVTAGIPGTGLFWTKKINSSPNALSLPQPQAPPPRVPQPNLPPAGGITRPINPPTPQAMGGGGIQSPPAFQTRTYVQMWVVYAAVSVIAIAGLCAAAAMVSGRITIPSIKSQTDQQVPVAFARFVSRSNIKNQEES